MNPTQAVSTLDIARRFRRLRTNETMRALVRETRLAPDMFVLPLFVCEGEGVRREVASMPGVFNLSVDEDNIDQAKDELDGLISQLDSNASGTIGETAGLPSVTYEDVPLETPTDGESTLVAIFDGETEYLLNCQSTPDHRDEVQTGCDQALATVATK